MNSEIVALQQDIMKEIANMPFVSSIDALFSEDPADSRKPSPASSSSSSSSSASEKRSFRSSLLSLVAEFIDCALLSLGAEFADEDERREGFSSSPLREGKEMEKTEQLQQWKEQEKCLLSKPFQWMDIVLADGMKDSLSLTIETVVYSSEDLEKRDPSPSSSSPSTTSPSSTLAKVRIALLPDHRSKALYLASLADSAAVQALIAGELRQRLEELLLARRRRQTLLFPELALLGSPSSRPSARVFLSKTPPISAPQATATKKEEEKESFSGSPNGVEEVSHIDAEVVKPFSIAASRPPRAFADIDSDEEVEGEEEDEEEEEGERGDYDASETDTKEVHLPPPPSYSYSSSTLPPPLGEHAAEGI
jgi:hypothetical protein